MVAADALTPCNIDALSDIKPLASEAIDTIETISAREDFKTSKEGDRFDLVFSVEYRWFDAYFVEVLRYSESELEGKLLARGLILAPDGQRKGQFCRVGTFR